MLILICNLFINNVINNLNILLCDLKLKSTYLNSMKNFLKSTSLCLLAGIFSVSCSEKGTDQEIIQSEVALATPNFGGYESQIKYGEHLVLISGCNDCHTPKKMTARGPVLDTALWLSGHPAQMPAPDIDRKEVEAKGLGVTQTLTAWVGPWGISYAANLTSDATGIGNWEEENFMKAMKEGKFKGLDNSRTILPPMPWEMFSAAMTDEELKAIFVYLKSTTPVKNLVPNAEPPLSAMQ